MAGEEEEEEAEFLDLAVVVFGLAQGREHCVREEQLLQRFSAQDPNILRRLDYSIKWTIKGHLPLKRTLLPAPLAWSKTCKGILPAYWFVFESLTMASTPSNIWRLTTA